MRGHYTLVLLVKYTTACLAIILFILFKYWTVCANQSFTMIFFFVCNFLGPTFNVARVKFFGFKFMRLWSYENVMLWGCEVLRFGCWYVWRLIGLEVVGRWSKLIFVLLLSCDGQYPASLGSHEFTGSSHISWMNHLHWYKGKLMLGKILTLFRLEIYPQLQVTGIIPYIRFTLVPILTSQGFSWDHSPLADVWNIIFCMHVLEYRSPLKKFNHNQVL